MKTESDKGNETFRKNNQEGHLDGCLRDSDDDKCELEQVKGAVASATAPCKSK